MGHTATKLHHFLTSSFGGFVQTDRETQRQTPPKATPCFQHSWRAGKYVTAAAVLMTQLHATI